MCLNPRNSPVNPQASASRKVLQDIKKKRAVSSRGKQCNLVNFVTLSHLLRDQKEILWLCIHIFQYIWKNTSSTLSCINIPCLSENKTLLMLKNANSKISRQISDSTCNSQFWLFLLYIHYKVWPHLLEVILAYSIAPFEVLARKRYIPAIPFRWCVPWFFRRLVRNWCFVPPANLNYESYFHLQIKHKRHSKAFNLKSCSWLQQP